MVQSMTGFGSEESNGLKIEIRSLNHRFIDISIKIPSYLSHCEIPLRNILKERFHRGKFDVTVITNDQKLTHLTINKEMARKIYTAFQDLQKELSIPGQIHIDTLIGYKELLIEEEPQYNLDALYAAFDDALSNLEAMRMLEGKLLSEELAERAKSLNAMIDKISSLSPHVLTKCTEKFSERLRSLLQGGETDSARIMQEAAIMAEKLDISEEISRIENHIKQFIETLSESNVIGRKLDFLLQEISREVNTLSYKSSDYTISSLAVEMKTEIEKMREQAQNIQ